MGPDEEIRLPLVDSHKYLGVVLPDKNYEALSLKYRLQQSWIALNRLTKALKNRTLPVRLRLQLYNSVCLATASCGLTSSGRTAEGRSKLRRANPYGRRRSLLVTGHSNDTVLQKYGISDPHLQGKGPEQHLPAII